MDRRTKNKIDRDNEILREIATDYYVAHALSEPFVEAGERVAEESEEFLDDRF